MLGEIHELIHKDLRQLQMLDSDNDGVVSEAEYAKYKDTVMNFAHHIDVDGDGAITPQEYEEFLEASRGLEKLAATCEKKRHGNQRGHLPQLKTRSKHKQLAQQGRKLLGASHHGMRGGASPLARVRANAQNETAKSTLEQLSSGLGGGLEESLSKFMGIH